MDVMFWIWLGVIVVSAIAELATMEIVSIWFTFGAIIPFILAATRAVSWEWQLLIFICVSAILIVGLRQITKKFLLRNSNAKTNTDAYIGQNFRMLSRTDFETVGTVKINDVVWSAVGENQQTIEEGEVIEIVSITGNKLIVKKADQKNQETSQPKPQGKKNVKKETSEEETAAAEKEVVQKKSAEQNSAKPKQPQTKKTTQKKASSSKTTQQKNKTQAKKPAVKPATKIQASKKTTGAKKSNKKNGRI